MKALYFAIAILLSAPLDAAERLYIKKSEIFCATGSRLCLDGTLFYRPNSRILSLNARVQKQVGPGTLRIGLLGNNRLGDLRRTEIVLKLRGAHSEIVNHQMRPDAPDVAEWRMSSFIYEPATP